MHYSLWHKPNFSINTSTTSLIIKCSSWEDNEICFITLSLRFSSGDWNTCSGMDSMLWWEEMNRLHTSERKHILILSILFENVISKTEFFYSFTFKILNWKILLDFIQPPHQDNLGLSNISVGARITKLILLLILTFTIVS